MDELIAQVRQLDTEDRLFHQRVYTLIGLEYSPEKPSSLKDLLH